MKKLILIFLIFIFVSCENVKDATVNIGDCIYDLQCEPSNSISFYASVYHIDDTYIFVELGEHGIIEKKIVFSDQRETIDFGEYDLIESECVAALDSYKDLSFEKIQNEWGEMHINIGSGLYIPSYITDDGYLVSFWVEQSTIVDICKSDIFTGEVIEKTWE